MSLCKIFIHSAAFSALIGSASAATLPDSESFSLETVSVFDVNPTPVSTGLRTWTYADCVDYAIANNPDIRQDILAILLAEEDIASAKDAWLPSVDFSTSHSYTNYPAPTDGRSANAYNSSYGINGSWTVWEGNARKYRLESARLLRRQQVLTGADRINEIRLSILSAYLNILFSREAVDIARQTLEVSTSQTDRATKLTEAGRSSRVDLAQIESQKAQDEYNLVQAESDLESNIMALKELLALRLDSQLDIAHTVFPDTEIYSLLPDQTVTFATATSWLPEFESNSLAKDVYDNDVKVAKAGRLPEITAHAGVATGYATGGRSWTSQMGHGFNEAVGLTLSVPLFDGNKTKRAVAKAKLEALEYDITQDRLLNQLSQTIENLYVQARTSRAKYESGKVRLESMELTSELVDRQFELGLVNPLELLTAHNNLLSARLEQLQNKYMAILANKTIEFYNTQNISLP